MNNSTGNMNNSTENTNNSTTCSENIEIYEDNRCNWTLVPKNYMVVCLGDPVDNSKVTSVYLQPIIICNSNELNGDDNVYDIHHNEPILSNC
jgi:hypothetical protein